MNLITNMVVYNFYSFMIYLLPFKWFISYNAFVHNNIVITKVIGTHQKQSDIPIFYRICKSDILFNDINNQNPPTKLMRKLTDTEVKAAYLSSTDAKLFQFWIK